MLRSLSTDTGAPFLARSCCGPGLCQCKGKFTAATTHFHSNCGSARPILVPEAGVAVRDAAVFLPCSRKASVDEKHTVWMDASEASSWAN